MPTKQKMRTNARPSLRQRSTLGEAGDMDFGGLRGRTDRKVHSWLFDEPLSEEDDMNRETDVYRGKKRKRKSDVPEVTEDGSEEGGDSAADHGQPSKKYKKNQGLAFPQFGLRREEKRTASYGGNRDEDVPDYDATRGFRGYDHCSSSDDDGARAPVTPTPNRAYLRLDGFRRVRGQGRVDEQNRIRYQALLSAQRQNGFRAAQHQNHHQVQQPGHHAQPNLQRPTQYAIQQPRFHTRSIINQADQLPTRVLQNVPQQPAQHCVQQAIAQVVHKPQYALQQDDQRALNEVLEQAAQDFLRRTPNQFLPPTQDRLPAGEVIAGTQNDSPSPTPNRLAVRPKPRPTPKKKTQDICSTLPADYFFSIPTEIREHIFRHLLISNKPIQVSKIWTDVARAITRRAGRGRSSAQQREEADDDTTTTIDARILSVCHQAHLEGSRILYSENTFFYKLRDGDSVPPYALTPPSPPSSTGHRPTRDTSRTQDWHARWLASATPGPINFEKYAPLLRRLRVELEPNRSTDEKYENLLICALEALVNRHPPGHPHQISLHVLSLAISPSFFDDGPRYLTTARFFAPGHRVMRALKQITTNYLHLDLHVDLAGVLQQHPLPGNGDQAQPNDDDAASDSDNPGTRHLETTIDMRYTPRHMQAVPPSDAAGADLWARDALMREKRAARGRRAEMCLAQLRRRIEGACVNPDEAIRRNWFDDHDDAEYWRMKSPTGWAGTCEVEDVDEYEDRELFVSFRRDGVAGGWTARRT